MTLARSLAFQALYYAASAFFVLTALPLLALPRRALAASRSGADSPHRRTVRWPNRDASRVLTGWIRCYTRLMVWLMRRVGGIGVRIEGRERLPDAPFIVAAKHQSWGDGFCVHAAIPDLAFVTGDHLMRYPLLGPVLRGLGAIVVRSCGGAAERGRLLAAELQAARAARRPILIYPEGHLSPVGTQHRYRKGVYHLYEAYGVPVVPVATDLGVRWPQQQVALRPGPCSVEFLDPIEPGLGKDEFMARLEEAIEGRSLGLLREQAAAGTLPASVAVPAPGAAPVLVGDAMVPA